MNCSKTSRSAWSQSFKALSLRHPPAHQSSRARRSICSWTPRCSPDVKPTIGFLSGVLIERFFVGLFMRLVKYVKMPGVKSRHQFEKTLVWLVLDFSESMV
jgi:hypothetical protein